MNERSGYVPPNLKERVLEVGKWGGVIAGIIGLVSSSQLAIAGFGIAVAAAVFQKRNG